MSQDEHDADAFYLDHVDVVLGERAADGDQLADTLLWAGDGLHLQANVWAPQEKVSRTYEPPLRSYDCPLYLLQLTLLH